MVSPFSPYKEVLAEVPEEDMWKSMVSLHPASGTAEHWLCTKSGVGTAVFSHEICQVKPLPVIRPEKSHIGL